MYRHCTYIGRLHCTVQWKNINSFFDGCTALGYNVNNTKWKNCYVTLPSPYYTESCLFTLYPRKTWFRRITQRSWLSLKIKYSWYTDHLMNEVSRYILLVPLCYLLDDDLRLVDPARGQQPPGGLRHYPPRDQLYQVWLYVKREGGLRHYPGPV